MKSLRLIRLPLAAFAMMAMLTDCGGSNKPTETGYRVRAWDAAGNQGVFSAAVTIVIGASGDGGDLTPIEI